MNHAKARREEMFKMRGDGMTLHQEAINELADKHQFERPYGQVEELPLNDLGKIAAYWSAHLGASISAADVVPLMHLAQAKPEAGAK